MRVVMHGASLCRMRAIVRSARTDVALRSDERRSGTCNRYQTETPRAAGAASFALKGRRPHRRQHAVSKRHVTLGDARCSVLASRATVSYTHLRAHETPEH